MTIQLEPTLGRANRLARPSWFHCFVGSFVFGVLVFTPIAYGLKDLTLGLGTPRFDIAEFVGTVVFISFLSGLCLGTIAFDLLSALYANRIARSLLHELDLDVKASVNTGRPANCKC